MMTEEYRELSGVIDLPKGSDFIFPRSQALVSAIEKQRDYSIVKLQRCQDSKTEYILVEVETHGVPPKNPYGIHFRERLAFCITENPKQLIDVRAMRRDFPTLLHQNQIYPGDAPSLCLYFEPPISVLRTWTPQNFLRRVQWWLEMSARGELHVADQPVEQLFFVSKYELVLPWNFDELLKDSDHAFRIVLRVKRSEDAGSFFLENGSKREETGGLRAECVEVTLPAVLHGVIEYTPETLGQLSDQLSERGIDFLGRLKSLLEGRVGEHGEPISSDTPHTIILLHVPLCREIGAPAETTHHRAFFVDAGPLKLGEEFGSLFEHSKKYFNAAGLLGAHQKTDWRDRPIFSVEVLRENDAAAARHQSGMKESGPVGVLIGVGSLGSAMLNIWGRSGWGRWSIIDKDHVKPHNLSRHVAYIQDIGQPKALVAASIHSAAMNDGSVTPLCKDACNFDDEEVAKSLRGSNLVIDASTTLEYPRQASLIDDFPRHVSAFIAPSGNSAVILAEDSKRLIRLRSLESQYYRAMIQNDWGKDHLRGNLGKFWSGASCRDISTVLPYSKIMVQAGTLRAYPKTPAQRRVITAQTT